MIEDIVEMTLMKVTKVTVDANVQMNCDLHELRELQEVNCEWVRNLELDWSSHTSWSSRSSRKSHSSSELQEHGETCTSSTVHYVSFIPSLPESLIQYHQCAKWRELTANGLQASGISSVSIYSGSRRCIFKQQQEFWGFKSSSSPQILFYFILYCKSSYNH